VAAPDMSRQQRIVGAAIRVETKANRRRRGPVLAVLAREVLSICRPGNRPASAGAELSHSRSFTPRAHDIAKVSVSEEAYYAPAIDNPALASIKPKRSRLAVRSGGSRAHVAALAIPRPPAATP
jgi:hypothetical protein